MSICGKRGALAGLEVHEVAADAPASQRQRRLSRLIEQGEIDAEATVRRLGSADRLENKIDRRAHPDELERGRDMGQNATLRRDDKLLTDLVKKVKQHMDLVRTVSRRIDADCRVAGTEKKAIDNAGDDSSRIIGRMIRLEANREPTGQPNRIAKSRDDVALRRHHHQVLQAADLGDGGGPLRGNAWRQGRQNWRSRLVR